MSEGHIPKGGKYIPVKNRIWDLYNKGAAGIILKNTLDVDSPSIEVAAYNQTLPVSCVSVSKKTGEEITKNCINSMCEMFTAGKASKGSCCNLLAEIKGNSASKEIILLGAHLDSFHISPGAFDNLTGVVTVLNIARMLFLSRYLFDKTLRIVFFTAEEYGFKGSRHYVENCKDLVDIKFVLNMDCLFDETAKGMAFMWAPEMKEYVDKTLFENLDTRNLFCMSSDYLPFMLKGIPCARPADFTSSFPVWSHSELDGRENIPVAWIRENAIVYAGMLERMLKDRLALPKRDSGFTDISAMIEKEGVGEIIKAYEAF